MLAAAAAVAMAGAAVASVWPRLRRYVDAACTPGACAPRASARCQRVSRAVVRACVNLQVGPVSVVGPPHQLSELRPFILAANHSHYADGLVIAVALGFPAYGYGFVAHGALTWAWGLGALSLASLNTVCVDLRRGRGVGAFRTGVRLLTSGNALLVFPEGWAHMDGRRGQYQNGTVAMAQRAAALSGRAVFVVPASIRYPRHPGAWITTWPPAWQYAIALLAFPFFRRGATMTLGTPIDARDLPTDVNEATRRLEAAIDALSSSRL